MELLINVCGLCAASHREEYLTMPFTQDAGIILGCIYGRQVERIHRLQIKVSDDKEYIFFGGDIIRPPRLSSRR
ncbi:MAG: hypothetical protein KIH01_04715, partial [Candidatus Freyarchaeota archaeon]|nr:hypothetical protein [Candidatus Jordarchaeia archaeon]